MCHRVGRMQLVDGFSLTRELENLYDIAPTTRAPELQQLLGRRIHVKRLRVQDLAEQMALTTREFGSLAGLLACLAIR